jgi:hypothetical protein
MRLIDADKSIEEYTQIFVEKFGIEGGEMFKGVIKQMPTAYDVDKVVEELDAYITKLVGKNSALYQTIISIVKAGGIDD